MRTSRTSSKNARRAVVAGVSLVMLGNGCASVYPLEKMAKRVEDPRQLAQVVTVDTTMREAKGVKKLAWVAYSATFDCDKACAFSEDERRALCREIAETSFTAFDRELRRSFAAMGERELAETQVVVSAKPFAQSLQTGSFRATVSRWLSRLGLVITSPVMESASGLKAVDPSELGWSGASQLAALGRDLEVGAVLVGHLRVTADEDLGHPRRLVIHGPMVWAYSSSTGNLVAVADLRPGWHIDVNDREATPAGALTRPGAEAARPAQVSFVRELRETRLDWDGIDAVANGFGSRVAEALR